MKVALCFPREGDFWFAVGPLDKDTLAKLIDGPVEKLNVHFVTMAEKRVAVGSERFYADWIFPSKVALVDRLEGSPLAEKAQKILDNHRFVLVYGVNSMGDWGCSGPFESRREARIWADMFGPHEPKGFDEQPLVFVPLLTVDVAFALMV